MKRPFDNNQNCPFKAIKTIADRERPLSRGDFEFSIFNILFHSSDFWKCP